MMYDKNSKGKNKDFLRHSVGTLVDVTLGGAAMKVVGDSSMPKGLKQATNIGIGAGIAGRAYGRFKKSSKDWL